MTDLASEKTETPTMNFEEARSEQRKARWAATGAILGGVAVGLGVGVVVGTGLELAPAIDALVGAGAGIASGGSFVVLGLEWLDDATEKVQKAQASTAFTAAS